MKNYAGILLAFVCVFGYSQTQNYEINDECIELHKRMNKFSDINYQDVLKLILDKIGIVNSNFTLVECPDINNAVAWVIYNNNINGSVVIKRVIAYDQDFMKKIRENSNDYSRIGILAHEVGHHLLGHTFSKTLDLKLRRKNELNADEFAGFILQKCGASLDEAKLFMDVIGSDFDDSKSTHPTKNIRLKAIEKGYLKAKNDKKVISQEDNKSVRQLSIEEKRQLVLTSAITFSELRIVPLNLRFDGLDKFSNHLISVDVTVRDLKDIPVKIFIFFYRNGRLAGGSEPVIIYPTSNNFTQRNIEIKLDPDKLGKRSWRHKIRAVGTVQGVFLEGELVKLRKVLRSGY